MSIRAGFGITLVVVLLGGLAALIRWVARAADRRNGEDREMTVDPSAHAAGSEHWRP